MLLESDNLYSLQMNTKLTKIINNIIFIITLPTSFNFYVFNLHFYVSGIKWDVQTLPQCYFFQTLHIYSSILGSFWHYLENMYNKISHSTHKTSHGKLSKIQSEFSYFRPQILRMKAQNFWSNFSNYTHFLTCGKVWWQLAEEPPTLRSENRRVSEWIVA